MVSDGTFRVQARGQNAYPYALLGTFSPYLVVHRASVVKIDPTVPFEAAALVSCGAHHSIWVGGPGRFGPTR